MSTLLDENKQWLDSNNSLIVDGYIFIGTHGQNPTLGYPEAPVNLITIYSDPELSIALSNPQRTDAFGKSVNKIWIPSTKYSIAVWDSETNQEHIDLNRGNEGLSGNHYDTIPLAVADIALIEIGDILVLDGRVTKGDGGGATWDAVDATTVTENELDIVTGSATVSLQLRDGYRTNPKALGAIGDGLTVDTAVFTYIETLTDNDIRLPDGTYIVNGIVLAKRYLGPGMIKLDGVDQGTNVTFDSVTVNKSLYTVKGADIASANDCVLLADGNSNDVTGTTTTNGMTDGVLNEIRTLQYDGAVPLKHDTAPSAGFSKLFISGYLLDYTTTAGDVMQWQYDGAYWRIIGGTHILPGRTIQVVNTQTGEVATGTTLILLDDTIPQNTEGDEYMTLSVTPKSSSNKLKIDVLLHLSSTAINSMVVGLFQDSAASALAANSFRLSEANGDFVAYFTHYMTSGTSATTTFKVRAGGVASATTTFNGISSGRKLGGVLASSITITEIKA